MTLVIFTDLLYADYDEMEAGLKMGPPTGVFVPHLQSTSWRTRARGAGRQTRGYTLAEFAPTLLIAFSIIIFPMLALGTIGTRYIFLLNAARLAAQSASRCQSFVSNSPSNGAVTTALNVSKAAINGIGGNTVSWIATDTRIDVCALGSTVVSTPGPNTALSAPANPVSNSYNCVVRVHATIQPVFPGWSALLGNIPGLNANLDAWAQGNNFFENTSNLNQ